MSDNPTQGEGMERAAEYVLGLLDPDAARTFEAEMVTDPAARGAYAFWATSFAAMTDDIPSVTPPDDVQARISASLFGAKRKPRTLMERLGARPLAFAMTAMALTVFLVVTQPFAPAAFDPEWHADLVSEDGTLFVQVGFDVDTGRWLTFRDAGDPREGRALELWLIDGDNPPISLGTLPATRDRVFATYDTDLSALMNGGVMAISDEPPGGSPTGAPTGEILVVAELYPV